MESELFGGLGGFFGFQAAAQAVGDLDDHPIETQRT
jgi:hypothetical protein